MKSNNNNNNNNDKKSQDSKYSVGLPLPNSKQQKVTAGLSGEHQPEYLNKKRGGKKKVSGDVEKFLIDKAGEKKGRLSSRHFQITLNEPEKYEKIKKYITGLSNFKFLYSVEEYAPTTDHRHIHIYIQFSKKATLYTSKLEGAHLELCKGDAVSNINYIEKLKDPRDKIIEKIGEPDDMIGVQGGKSRFPTISEIEKMNSLELKKLPAQYYNIVDKIISKRAQNISIESFNKWPVTVYYICGESGIGKTRMAQYLIKSWGIHFNNVKYENTFWMGVSENSNIALYDDWRDSHMKPSELINFIDYNTHIMNIKGGFIQNKYKKIIITSIQHWDDIYKGAREKDDELPQQWERRMRKIFINNNYINYLKEGAEKLEKILKNPLNKEEEKEAEKKEKYSCLFNCFYTLLNYNKINKEIEQGYSLSLEESKKEIKNLFNIPSSGDHIPGFN